MKEKLRARLAGENTTWLQGKEAPMLASAVQ